MRNHELELIAALVEGRLEDETEARALIASSPEYREEYEAQKLAHETLQGVGSAALTDSERASLHRDLWTELHKDAAPTPTRGPWLFRWGAVAAGLFVVVGLVAVLSQAGGGDAADTIVAADSPAAATTTTAAAESLDESGGEAAPGDGEETEPTGDGDDSGADTAGAYTLSEEARNVYQREADLLRQGVYGDRLRSYDSEDTTIEACVEESGLDDHRILATLSAPMEETDTPEDERRLAVAYPEGAQLDTAPISFVDLDTCEVVYTDE